MAMTVEPGLYIRPSPQVPAEFWNIGVRLEDEVLVTADDPDVLTGALEKSADAIEALMHTA
jgi:Xaa-Pro aminopeptidase